MLVGHHIGRQACVTRLIFPGQDNRFLQGWVLDQRGFDFPQLNTDATDFYLLVGAAKELKVAVREVAGEVTGLVQARPRLPAKGVEDELLSRQLGPVEYPRANLPPMCSSPTTPIGTGCR